MAAPSARYNLTMSEQAKISELGDNAVFAATALLLYSHLILLGQEIQYIWNRPFRPASCLYGLIRYPALLQQLIDTGLNSYTPHCTPIARLATWSQTIAGFATYSVPILRTYAICGKSKVLAAVLLALCLPVLAILAFSSVGTSCTSYEEITPVLDTVGAVLDVVFESIVVSSTIWVTWSQVMMAKRSEMSRRTIAYSLTSNGLVYYSVFLATQVCFLVSKDLEQKPTVMMLNVFVSQLMDPLRWVLVCQFILERSERSEKLSRMSDISLRTITSFRAALDFVEAAIDQDFGEPPGHPIHGMDHNETDEESAVGRTVQTETQRELEEGMELRERYLAAGDA